MKKVINLLLISIILLQLTAVVGVQASGTPFSISGTVVDRYGNPLPGADVQLIDNAHKVISSKKTNENGNYDFVNMVADTDTCTLRVSITVDGKTYTTPTYYTRWYPTSGMQFVPSKETQIPSYPPPVYGYLYGAIQTSMSANANFINGVVYLVSLDNEVKYYEFATRTDGKGSYTFYVPPGTYTLYAQHSENGVIYESARKQVTIEPNSEITDVLPTPIILPLNSPSNNPDPAIIPTDHSNKVNGTVKTKDGKGFAGATVTIYERSDNGTDFIKKDYTATTDSNGYYEFNGVTVTTDDNKEIQSRKDIKVGVEYTDPNTGAKQTIMSDSRPLYYPNMLMGFGVDEAARNVNMPAVTLPYAVGGWVSLTSIPQGANIYIDGQELFGPDGKPLQTPCTAYIDPGMHQIKMGKEGYADSTDTITMEANKEHPQFIMQLNRPVVPPWVTLIVAIIILLVVAALIIFLLASRLHTILGPLGAIFGGIGHKIGDVRASREIAKSHRAEVAEQRRIEQQRTPERTRPDTRVRKDEPIRQKVLRKEKDTSYDVMNVDAPMKKRHEEGRKLFEEGKKILDLKGIANSVPKKTKAREPVEAKERPSPMRFASDIYKKPTNDVERIQDTNSIRQQPPVEEYVDRSEREALVERRQNLPERMRIPKTVPRAEGTVSMGDKERVLRYVRDHPEGVSFIQMSNDLEIVPNNLTYITKELVINDDIEKVKGLYYYKSHTSSSDDASSSVVVWRLDGDK